MSATALVLNALRKCVPGQVKAPLKRILGLPKTRLHPNWQVLAPIGPIYHSHVIIDVGAHHGWFFHCWLDWCPQGQVHAFEPYPPSFEIAFRNYGSDPRVHLVPMAMGDAAGEQTLNVLEDSLVSNSLLEPRSETWSEVQYRTGRILRRRVPVATLDIYAKDIGRIYLVKIDVQGYEMHVLHGADQTLSRVDYILVESGIRPLYENAPRFSDVFEHLSARGFHLIAMQGWHRGNHTLIEADMLFRSNELMPPVDESITRVTNRIA